MENKLLADIRLFFLFLKLNILKSMEYRVNFLTSLLPTGMYTIGFLIFLKTIYSKISLISGWNFNQMLFLFTVEQIFLYSSYFFYRHSLDSFSEDVKNGSFDQYLRYPRNIKLLVSFKVQEPYLLTPFLIALSFLVYSIIQLHIHLTLIPVFIFLIFIGSIILYNFMFIVAALSFWFTETSEILDLADEAISFSRYPIKVFPAFLAFILITIFPTLLVVYVPATAFLGKLEIPLVVLMFILLPLSFIISQKIWQTGLKHYSSASS